MGLTMSRSDAAFLSGVGEVNRERPCENVSGRLLTCQFLFFIYNFQRLGTTLFIKNDATNHAF